MRRLFIPPMALLLFTACPVPSRNNPADPALAPEAIIRVYLRQPDGTDVPGTQGGQQTTFVLDASDSFDPHGSGELSFDWDLTDIRWDVGAADDWETASNDGSAKLVTKLPLTRTMLAHDGISTGVGTAPREVRLRVTTSRGSKAYATASVLLHNAAPAVEPAEVTASPVDLPVVMLDACGGIPPPGCTSSDPDGDPIAFTWEQVRGEPVALVPIGTDGARVQFQPPDAKPLEFKVVADDGVATAEAFVPVRFETQVWVSTQAPARLYRVYPEFAVRTGYRNTAGTVAFGAIESIAARDGDMAVGRADGSVLRLDRHFRLQRSWTLPNAAVSLAVTDGGGLCASSGSQFHRLHAGGSVITTTDAGAVGVIADGSGCWTIGGSLGRFDGGGWVPFAATGGLADAALLPDDTLWVLTTAGTLARLDANASTPVVVSVPLDPESIAPHPDGVSLLATDAATGLPWRIARNGTADVDDDLPAIGAVDAMAGSVWEWKVDDAELRHHRRRNGSYRENVIAVNAADLTNSDTVFTHAYPDTGDDSLLVVLNGYSVARVPAHMTRSKLVASFNETPRVTADPSTGAVWVDAGAGLQRLSNGRVVAEAEEETSRFAVALPNGDVWVDPYDGSYALARIDRYGVEQERIPLDDRSVTHFDRAGSTLCVATEDYTNNGSLLRVDLATVPPLVVPLAVDMDFAGAAAALPDGACWFSGIAGFGAPDHLVHFAAGSTTADSEQVQALTCGGRILADPRSGFVFGACAGGAFDQRVSAHCLVASDASCLDRWMVFGDGRVRLGDGAFGQVEERVLSVTGKAERIEVVP